MRTSNEINQMFKDMNLHTEEKRAKFNFSYACSSKGDHEILPLIFTETKTKELRNENDAELE